MNQRAIAAEHSLPKLAAHMRLRFDKARDCWTIQAPERSFMLDAVAHAIVSRCDGAARLDRIVDDLCTVYSDGPRDAIRTDVFRVVQDFADKGVMTL